MHILYIYMYIQYIHTIIYFELFIYMYISEDRANMKLRVTGN